MKRVVGRACRLLPVSSSTVLGSAVLSSAVFGLVALGCADEVTPPARGSLTAASAPPGFPTGPLVGTAPIDNALTEDRAALGRRLFYDTQLSRTREIACASCHVQERGFADPSPVSTGVEGRRGTRNAPSLVNLAWSKSFFWDGRAPTLEDQAGQPIENPVEMDLALEEAVLRLAADDSYQRAFFVAYGSPPTPETLRKALANFVRTLVSNGSPYDRHLMGDDAGYPAAAARGEALFFGEKSECFHCHVVGRLTNEGFFNNGSFEEGGDPGRKAITGRSGDLGKFKVPGLRNVAVSAPYMHDGSVATLRDVLRQYEAGGRGHPSTDPQVRPLALTAAQVDDLLAFLEALTDDAFLVDARFQP